MWSDTLYNMADALDKRSQFRRGFLSQGNWVTTLVVVKTPSSNLIILEIPIAILSCYMVPDTIMSRWPVRLSR